MTRARLGTVTIEIDRGAPTHKLSDGCNELINLHFGLPGSRRNND